MIPVSLSLRNFLSYGENVSPLDFAAFHVACISGRNGHGKSALLDAVTWALWGEARKAGTERKPDEGLLRIGASEMQVNFEFELEGERYRVTRSYRKTARSGASTLELQVFSPQDGGYKTLSESGSIRQTQQRLDDLLRMSYDTFINSAFILQGRADEFTRRNARERKTILAEILGLTRYDDLAVRARAHAQDAAQEAAKARAQLEEIEAAVAQKDDLTREIAAVAERLDATEKELAEAEARLEGLRAEQARLDAHRREKAGLKDERTRLAAEQEDAETQAGTAQQDVAACREILDRREDILAAVEQHAALQAEDARLRQKLQALRDLEKRQNDLDREIADARHEVERRLDMWNHRVAEVRKDLQEAEEVLAHRAEIDAGLKALKEADDAEAGFEDRREKREALERELRDLEARFEAARSEIQVSLQTQQGQQQRLQTLAADLPHLQETAQTARRQLEGIREQEAERDRIRERGTALAAAIEAAQNRRSGLLESLEDAEKQQASLEEIEGARCPLCGSALDAQHRREVHAQLAERAEKIQAETACAETEIQASEAERERCRRQYQEIKNRLAASEGDARTAAQADAALLNAEKAADDLAAVQQEVAALEAQLKEFETAGPEAVKLAEARQQLDGLAYDADAHRALRAKRQEIETFKERNAQLQMAEDRKQKAEGILQEHLQKQDMARIWLNEKRYAPRAQEELDKLRQTIDAAGYDAERHRQISEQIERIRETADMRGRLESAEREVVGAQTRLQAARKRIGEIETRMSHAQARERELDAAIASEKDRAQEVDEHQTRIRDRRAERDRLFQERAGLQARYDRCSALESTQDGEKSRLQQAEKDLRIYRELTTAFGKDGIQALIIEQAIPEIEEEANRILSRLTDNRTQITLESLRDLKKGGTRETLDIRISDELGERNYELYSGGEAFRVDFSIRIALSKLLARRAGTRLRTLVIDEGFGTQDLEGLDHLVEAIQAISDDFEKILVITHVDALKQAFPVRIEVTKYPDAGSRFEVIY